MQHYIKIERVRTADIVVDDSLTLKKTQMHFEKEISLALLKK